MPPLALYAFADSENFTFTFTRINYAKIHETDREIGMLQMNSLHVFVENTVDCP